MSTSQEFNRNSNNSRRRLAAGLTAAALVGGGVGYALHGGSNHAKAPKAPVAATAKPHATPKTSETPTVSPKQTELANAKKYAQTSLKGSAIATSMSILKDLDKPSAGNISYAPTKSYTVMTNKGSILEPNSSTTNPSYKYVPEIRAGYYPQEHLATVLATSEAKVPSGSHAGKEEFTSVDMGFNVDPNSKFAHDAEKRKLTTDDFRALLKDPSTTLDMVSVGYNSGADKNGAHPFGVEGKGVTFYDGNVYSDNSGLTDTDNYLIGGGIKSTVKLMTNETDPTHLVSEVAAIRELLPKAAGQLAIFAENQLPPNSSLSQ